MENSQPKKHRCKWPQTLTKFLRMMKLATLFLFIGCMQLSARAYSQKSVISLSVNNVSLKKAFSHIRKESGYLFLYNNERIHALEKRKVSFSLKDATIQQVLDECLKGIPLSYKIISGTIIITPQPILSLKSLPNLPKPIDISGSVRDSLGNPLIGVSIKVKGTDVGTISDANGNFILQIPDENAILEASYVGFNKEEIPVKGRTTITIILKQSIAALNQLVVIGYGTSAVKDITGAISSVKVNQMSANVSPNVSAALQGRVPGVTVESAGGAPGANLSITIRGSSTLGNNTPLYVVDGMFLSNIDFINPSDIQNIEVLKDAAAASIYGSRAANGVIIITTKSGIHDSKPKVQISAMYGMQDIPRHLSVLNGEEWTKVFKANTTGTPDYNGINTDWQNVIFRTAPIRKANINISGGTSNFVYNVSGGYLDQLGTVKKTKYSSANFRVKTQYEKGRIKVGETVMLQKSQGRVLPSGGDQAGSNITSSLIMPSIVPVYDTSNPLGGWGRRPSFVKNLANPLANLVAKDWTNNNFTTVADAFIEIRLIDQLKYKLNVGFSDNRNSSHNYVYPYDDGNISTVLPNLSQSSGIGSTWLVENTIHYDKDFGRHHISLLAGYTAQKDSSEGYSASGSNIPINVFTLNGVTSNQSVGGTSSSVRRVSLLGRIQYNYASRYLFMASIRRDGSSIFSPGYQYGVFPSLSAGWNISNESFFKESKVSSWINFLKIRGSWGILGNDLIGAYTTQSTITANANYLEGNQLWQGAYPNGNASPANLKWEQTKTIDGGLDAHLLDSRLSLTIDVFKRTTSGVLLGVPVPPSIGITGSPVVNAGIVENKGIELSIDYEGQSGDFKYDVGANFSTLQNKMTAITIGSGAQKFGDITQASVGYPLGGFWLIRTNGIFQSDAEAAAYTGKNGQPIQPNAKGGDIKFVDFNGDGQINNNDRQFCGTPFPKATAGIRGYFTWRNFDLNILLQGTFGNELYDQTAIWLNKMTEVINYSTNVLNAWTPSHHTNFPRFIITDPNLNAQAYSDRWLENGDYIRFRRFELGYTILKKFTQRMKMDQIRVNVAADNIFTLTRYDGYNPDIGNGGNPLSRGIDNGGYPLQRTVSFGLDLTF